MNTMIQRVATRATLVALLAAASGGAASAATITVNSLADDVFPNNTGAIFDAGGSPITLSASKCTLRMAIASANLDLPVGGATFGCVSGAAGADTIVFDGSLNLATTPGTITLADKVMSEAPASYSGGNTAGLAIAGPLTVTGPGSTQLTIDGVLLTGVARRILTVSDGSATVDSPLTITGLRFYRGRSVDGSAGCMFASESVTLSDVTFENCESIGGASSAGYGGALGLGNFNVANGGTYRPTISISNSAFVNNRAVRGTSTARSENGALSIGSGTRMAGAVTLTNAVFNGNSAERHGAMLITDVSSVAISGSHFIGNAATGSIASNSTNASGNGRYGGFAIVNVSGNVTIDNWTRVNGNVANEERGGFGVLTVGGAVTIDTVDVSGNYVNRGRIGGFEVLTDTFDASNNCTGTQLKPVNVSNVRVMGNSVATTNGAFRVICSGALTWTHGWILGNEARGYRLLRSDVVASGNSAGSLSPSTDATAAGSTAVLTDVVFQNNQTTVTGAGGGGSNVFTVNGLGQFTGDSLRFSDNSADAGGMFVLNANGAGRNYLVINSEIAHNWAPNVPGLFIQTDGSYTLRNSTVATNQSNAGSAVHANVNTDTTNGISVTIDQSTIARNQSPVDALTISVGPNIPHPGVATPTLFTGANAAITIRNSILGSRAPGYTGSPTVFFDTAHAVTNVTSTNTLLEWNGGTLPANFCGGTGMRCNVGALLDSLNDNGNFYDSGLRTMALLAGSPAINAGGAVTGGLTTDARGTGYPRVIGSAVDMGAYESSPGSTYGCTIDVDGNGSNDALTDGLVLIRALFGLTGTAATNGAIGGGATRGTWSAIQAYLSANCGTSF